MVDRLAEEIRLGAQAIGGLAGVARRIQLGEKQLSLKEQELEQGERRLSMQEEESAAELSELKRLRLHDDNVSRYLKNQAQSEEAGVPYKEDFSAPDFDGRAYSDAAVQSAVLKSNQAAFKTARLANLKETGLQAHTKIMKHVQDAHAALASDQKDWNSAFKNMELAYEEHNDGTDLILAKDQMSFKVNLPDGTENEFKFGSKEAMFKHFTDQAALISKPGDYLQKVDAEDQEISLFNANAMGKAMYWVNPQGDQATSAILRVRGENKGKAFTVIEVWDKENKHLGRISMAELQRRGFKDVTTLKKFADLKKTKAETKAKARTSYKNLSPEQKLALGIVEMFADDPDLASNNSIAMQWVLDNKLESVKIQAILSKVKERDYEELGFEHPQIKKMIKALNVPGIFGQGGMGYTGIAGGLMDLKKQKKSRVQATTAAQQEKNRVGGLPGKNKKSDFTEKQNEAMKAEALKMRIEGFTVDEIEEKLRDKYLR